MTEKLRLRLTDTAKPAMCHCLQGRWALPPPGSPTRQTQPRSRFPSLHPDNSELLQKYFLEDCSLEANAVNPNDNLAANPVHEKIM